MIMKQQTPRVISVANLARRIRKLKADQAKHVSVIKRLVKKLESINPLSERLKRHMRLLRDPNRK